MNNALAPTNGNAGAITRPQVQSPTHFEGEEEDDYQLPRLHIFQGLPKEREQFGKHEEGEIINTLTGEVMPSPVRFTPLFAFKEFIKFKEPYGSGIEYRTRNKGEVPAQDLEWDRVNNTPPAVTQIHNWVVVIEGQEMPCVLSFKSTSLATSKQLNGLEKLRADKGPGFYEIVLKAKSNNKGKWLHPTVAPKGSPPEPVMDLVNQFKGTLSAEKVSVDVDQTMVDAEAGDFNPDA